jgi:acetylornithine deacetylase/succinyl-diaminopimelate desuccinylase-like protein
MTRGATLAVGAAATALILVAAAWALDAAPPRAASRTRAGVPVAPAITAALSQVAAEEVRIVEDWIALASVPAWSGGEGGRADHVEREMRAMGLAEVGRDAAGNVAGILPGADRDAKGVVFMAHMDTVATHDADFTIHREGGTLRGPGVRDDSSGLSALLSAARAALEAGVRPPADVVIVASVEEEVGLKGSRAWLEAHGDNTGAFVAVDGYLGQISYGATSIFWARMHFKAPGSHTLRSYQHPSATLAVALAVKRVYDLRPARSPEERESWLNIGMLGGGDVPNAQSRDAWFSVDLRSNDPAAGERLEKQIIEICEEAADEVGVAFEQEILQRLEGASIPGHGRSKIVLAASGALDALQWPDVRLTPRGTADHNIAIQMGIPAIAVGVTTGEGAHTPTEYADIEPFATGVKQLVILMGAELY